MRKKSSQSTANNRMKHRNCNTNRRPPHKKWTDSGWQSHRQEKEQHQTTTPTPNNNNTLFSLLLFIVVVLHLNTFTISFSPDIKYNTKNRGPHLTTFIGAVFQLVSTYTYCTETRTQENTSQEKHPPPFGQSC